jgi:hypothetical protein
MAMEYTNNFHSKAIQNIPKILFFGLKKYYLATLVKSTSEGCFDDPVTARSSAPE